MASFVLNPALGGEYSGVFMLIRDHWTKRKHYLPRYISWDCYFDAEPKSRMVSRSNNSIWLAEIQTAWSETTHLTTFCN